MLGSVLRQGGLDSERGNRVKAWERIRAFAQGYGADVVPVPWERLNPQVEPAPFEDGLGIHWRKRIVYVDRDKLKVPVIVGNLIHELGHILAYRCPPRKSDEQKFLGWESLVARLVQCERFWLASMNGYGTTHGEWDWLSDSEKEDVLREAIELGVEYGNIVQGCPVSVRRFKKETRP